jgi:serine/threonine-protein kinase RsbW
MIRQPNASHFSTFCDTKNLKSIRDFVSNNLLENKISTQQIELIVLAVDEICSNAMIHSNHSDASLLLDISLALNASELIVEVSDQGESFSFDSYKELSLQELISQKKKGNMGLLLVKRIMDKIEYERNHETNICRMYKKVA